MRILHGAATDIGRVRIRNEDYLGWRVSPEGDPVGRGSLFVVADGVGGHAGGADASRIAVDTILRAYYASSPSTSPADALAAAILDANAAVYAGGAGHGRGTTVVAVAVTGGTAVVAHVGDSRVLLVRDGVATQVTEDHSWVWEMVRLGILTPAEARYDPRRNVITRWIGDRVVEPDLTTIPLQPDDRIVLCTDGLTGYLTPEQIASTVVRLPEQEAVDELCRLANLAGGADNITAIVVHVVPNAQASSTG